MLPVRNIRKDAAVRSSYVCLSCRLQSSSQPRWPLVPSDNAASPSEVDIEPPATTYASQSSQSPATTVSDSSLPKGGDQQSETAPNTEGHRVRLDGRDKGQEALTPRGEGLRLQEGAKGSRRNYGDAQGGNGSARESRPFPSQRLLEHRDVSGRTRFWNASTPSIDEQKKRESQALASAVRVAVQGHPRRNQGNGMEFFKTTRTGRLYFVGPPPSWPPPPSRSIASSARMFHTRARNRQETSVDQSGPPSSPAELASLFGGSKSPEKPEGIRHQLRRWQELHGDEDPTPDVGHPNDLDADDASNSVTRLADSPETGREPEQDEDERAAMEHYLRAEPDGTDGAALDTQFLQMGDLVELDFPQSEQEAQLAVFVRRIGFEGQFFTSDGRWKFLPERQVQYTIPGWISAKLVEPILRYLPEPKSTVEFEKLREQSAIEDLSVPRDVSGPLITKMMQFNSESLAIYRKHANALDNAHETLAHDKNLRYGSLTSVATSLLGTPREKLPVTALFTVRKAISNAGLAFSMDRRSHRLTGYLQIRSKEQVRTVNEVREWLRDWQDDLAARSVLANDPKRLAKRVTKQSARNVYQFVAKAKKIILESRKTRQPTHYGNIGPSSERFPITSDSVAVRTTRDFCFTAEDAAIIRFMESWACSGQFIGLNRLLALPPLILQATGLYEDFPLSVVTGYIFLQEIGTITPYENRVRFDQHLLLPSSQHSKPLQTLMSSLMSMSDNPDLEDSMKGLRKDWGNTSVYCIDSAEAHEIDDGISLQKAGIDMETGKEMWWVHVHIANPTAFVQRDHAVSKMARHMGESLYFPERTYTMMPRWATQNHFSLRKDRPCLTFSTKLDSDGNVLDDKITPGIIRRVHQLTHSDVGKVLGLPDESPSGEMTFIVGAKAPPSQRKSRSSFDQLTAGDHENLKILRHLADKRHGIRRDRGAIYFQMKNPEVCVWHDESTIGLPWDHPFRHGSRSTLGDPVIQVKTGPLPNWFAPAESPVVTMVQEAMLLACETGARWCADRDIPGTFRGTVPKPDTMDPEKFRREQVEPARIASPTGEIPMPLGILYLQSLGTTKLSSSPIPHKVMGLPHYAKVTSPLRRYGDMIMHWQIEAAIRHEAATGKSLKVTPTPNNKRPKAGNATRDLSFLPFPAPTLDAIMLGLQPRESVVSRSKRYSENFWVFLMLFRAVHFDECALPLARDPESNRYIMTVFVHSVKGTNFTSLGVMSRELNVNAGMLRPETTQRLKGVEARFGDVWEVEIKNVDVYHRTVTVLPRRLVERWE